MSKEIPRPPSARATDNEEVSWALSAANVLWDRKEYADALMWVRRAAAAAASAKDGARFAEVEARASEIAHLIEQLYDSSDHPLSMRPESGDLPRFFDPEVEQAPSDVVPRAPELPRFRQDRPEPSPEPLGSAVAGGMDRPRLHRDRPVGAAQPTPTSRSPVPRPPMVGGPFAPAPYRSSMPEIAVSEGSIDIDVRDLVGVDELEDALEETADETVDEALMRQSDLDATEPDLARSHHFAEPAAVEIVGGARGEAMTEAESARPEMDETTDHHAGSSEVRIDSVGEVLGDNRRTQPGLESEEPEPQPPIVERADTIADETGVAEDGARPLADLGEVEAFADLPEDTLQELRAKATINRLAPGEELTDIGVVLVLEGSVAVGAAVSDEMSARAGKGQVVPMWGTLDARIELKVVGEMEGTEVASWSPEILTEAVRACPWVDDDLRARGDRFQTHAAVVMGPIGEGLDPNARERFLEAMEMRVLQPDEVLVEQGQSPPGLVVIGAGSLELCDQARVVRKATAGDLLFASDVMAGTSVRCTARASAHGATLLLASAAKLREMIAALPPLEEILSQAE